MHAIDNRIGGLTGANALMLLIDRCVKERNQILFLEIYCCRNSG